jgi:hypothetical protein
MKFDKVVKESCADFFPKVTAVKVFDGPLDMGLTKKKKKKLPGGDPIELARSKSSSE